MKVLTVVILSGVFFGFVRFMYGLIKELAEFAVEAWHSGETEQ